MKFALTLDVSPARGLTFLQLAILLRQHRLHPESFLLRIPSDDRSRYWFVLEATQDRLTAFQQQLGELPEASELQVHAWSGLQPAPQEPADDFWSH